MVKERIIHILGGYTSKEYTRLERRYQGLLDSKTKVDSVKICNEYIYRLLYDLDKYASTQLFGLLPDIWAKKMYNVIHNNWLRVSVRYLYSDSTSIYRLDTTLDQPNQFRDIVKEDNIKDEVEFILENDNV